VLCITLLAMWCGVRMTHAVLCDVGFERETQHCRAVRCGVVWCHVEVEVVAYTCRVGEETQDVSCGVGEELFVMSRCSCRMRTVRGG
jgi:hypothetical protein